MKKGQKMRPESIEKMRLTKIGRKMPPRTLKHRKNIALAKLGDKNPMFGKHHSMVVRERIKLTMKKKAKFGSENHNWKGGYYDSFEKAIRHSTEYKVWRKHVFQRDDYTCQSCGIRGGNLVADHELPFALYVDLRFEILNGRTLCQECHYLTPTYGGRIHRETTC